MAAKTRQISKTDLEGALQKLYAVQPQAHAIRRQTCHCPKHALMLSYRLPVPEEDAGWKAREEALGAQGMHTCGFFCSACGFTNAGSRPVDCVLGDDVP